MDPVKISQLEAYELITRESLPDIHAEGIILKHRKSGARIMLLPCKDDNKVFNIAFRTPPADSTGVAHIIEHTVLCGSEHFPLKDPFVELAKGSLNTFLNAMTYPDKTMYPIASTNDTDFRNLMHVYLDAVFFPNIYHEQNIFRQEGWHYELDSPGSPLQLNGVVYSEMKGVFSSADDVLERETMNALFPDTSYGVESGGDPDVIPELTYEAYLDFHRRYYHPSNSYIFLYGDLDMADALDFIDREYLSLFDRLDIDSSIRRQEAFAAPRKVVREYPIQEDEETERNTYLSYNIVTGDPMNEEEMIAMSVLDYALITSPGAPLKKALLDEGIGLDVYGGYSDGIYQPYFNVTAKNADEADADRFVSIIRNVLAEQAESGIDRSSILAGLHAMEFSFREADYGSYPKGLYYTIYALETWLYDDAAPFAAFKQLCAYRHLRELADTGYFETMIREKLLGTNHCALVILRPKKGLAEERERLLAEKLAGIKAAMSEEEIRSCIRTSKELRAWQDQEETEEALAKLPVLKRSDLRREILPHMNEERTARVTFSDGTDALIPVVYHEAETNGIGYLELLFDAKRLPDRLIPYLGFLRAVLTGLSTESYGYQDLNNEINSVTGGLSPAITVTDVLNREDEYKAFFGIRMKALIPELVKGADLIREILYTSDFSDKKRIHELLSEGRSRLQATLQQSGHTTAATRASAYLFGDSAFADRTGGIAYYRFIKDLEDHFDEQADRIAGSLKETATYLFRPDNLIISFTSERDGLAVLEDACRCALMPDHTGRPLHDEVNAAPYGILNEGFTTSGQVQYVAMAGNFLKSGTPFAGAMSVFRQIMTYEYLWQQIRVRGGAYGCGAQIRRNGRGIFTSYRDPQLARTKEVFEGAPGYLRAFDADETTMTKYVIGTVSSIDTPLTPAAFGMVSMREYLRGMTDEVRQQYRDEIIDAKPSDIRAIADAVEAVIKDNCFCVVGGESAISENSELFGHTEPLL